MSQSQTIIALSSGALPSGVAVIRLSGPDAIAAAAALVGDAPLPPPRRLALKTLRHPQTRAPLDTGLVALFPAPHSFTGEDCVELQVHGSPAGVKALVSALTALPGVVLAGPGDFTRRAFENGKLDLVAVEGLGDLIAAETEGQRRQALARLAGGLGEKIAAWRDALLSARAEIEAHLDFSDEDDVPFALPDHFAPNLAALEADLAAALSAYERGRVTREGFRIVLAGAPNVGKSSLLNSLAGSDLAIVTPEAGTTRDTRDVSIDLDGQFVIVTDTAGLRQTESLAEAEGIKRANAAMARADLVLWLMAPDRRDAAHPALPAAPVWRIATKADLGPVPGADLSLSSRTGDGLDGLIARLKAHIGERMVEGEPALVSHLRDKDALERAIVHLHAARRRIDQPEICAEELRRASDTLAGLTGLLDAEAVLDRLFAGFCIGK